MLACELFSQPSAAFLTREAYRTSRERSLRYSHRYFQRTHDSPMGPLRSDMNQMLCSRFRPSHVPDRRKSTRLVISTHSVTDRWVAEKHTWSSMSGDTVLQVPRIASQAEAEARTEWRFSPRTPQCCRPDDLFIASRLVVRLVHLLHVPFGADARVLRTVRDHPRHLSTIWIIVWNIQCASQLGLSGVLYRSSAKRYCRPVATDADQLFSPSVHLRFDCYRATHSRPCVNPLVYTPGWHL